MKQHIEPGHPIIRIVDPTRIHRMGDTDFSDFQTHLSNKATPKGEIWVNSRLKREDHHVACALGHLEWADMMRGVKLSRSIDKQRILETKIRKKDKDHDLDIQPYPDDEPGMEPDVKSSQNIPSFTVNGEAVRNLYTTTNDNPFEQGGHDLRYSYIAAWAKKEGLPGAHWIDRTELAKKDYPPTADHEIDERNDMAEGMSYEVAHRLATKREKKIRKAS